MKLIYPYVVSCCHSFHFTRSRLIRQIRVDILLRNCSLGRQRSVTRDIGIVLGEIRLSDTYPRLSLFQLCIVLSCVERK